MSRRRALVPALFLLAAPLAAKTIVVDAGGGADYTDLPPAIAAASPGDLVLVLPGDYTAFTLDKGLTVLGVGATSTVVVHGTVLVDGPQVTLSAVLSTFYCTGLEASGCKELLLLEGLDMGYITHDMETAGSTALRIVDCADVRVLHTKIQGGPEAPTVVVGGSRIEFVQSELRAGGGCGYEPPIHDYPLCNPGVCLAAGGSRVRFALSSAIGEDGQDHYLWDLGGNGADGFNVGSTDLLISGRESDLVRSGNGGEEWGGCGTPLILSGSVARRSRVTLSPGWNWGYGDSCQPVLGCCDEVVAPFDPTLELLGAAVPGAKLALRLRAPRGSTARVLLGREPVVRPRVGVVEDVLLVPLRGWDLGTVPPTSEIDWEVQLPAGLRTGQLLFAQAAVLVDGGELRLTHSVPLLVH